MDETLRLLISGCNQLFQTKVLAWRYFDHILEIHGLVIANDFLRLRVVVQRAVGYHVSMGVSSTEDKWKISNRLWVSNARDAAPYWPIDTP